MWIVPSEALLAPVPWDQNASGIMLMPEILLCYVKIYLPFLMVRVGCPSSWQPFIKNKPIY